MRQFLMLAFFAVLLRQDPTPEALIKGLSGSDPKDRERCAAKLAAEGPAIVPVLQKALDATKEPAVRARIEQVFGRIRLGLHTPSLDDAFSAPFRREAAELIKRLRNPTPEVLLEALEATTGYRVVFDPARGRLNSVLGVKIPEATSADATLTYRIALSVLPPGAQSTVWEHVKAVFAPSAHLFKSAALLEDCLVHLEDPDVEFRRVIFQLSETGQRRKFIPIYIRLLDSPDSEVRLHAASKLSLMNPGDLAPAIAAKIERVSGSTRAFLIESLARTGDAQWTAVMIKYVESLDAGVKGKIVRALALLDPPSAVPHVTRMLSSRDPQMLQVGIQAASGLSDPRVCQALERIVLESSDAIMANQAVYSLVLCRPKNLSEILEKAMRHSSFAVRNAAACTAAMVGGDNIVRALESLLDDPNPNVRANAESSLANLKVKGHETAPRRLLDFGPEENDPAYLPFLLDLLEGPNELAAFEYLMRFRCSEPCREIQDLAIAWPTDRNPSVKDVLQTAAVALKSKGIALKVDLAAVDEKPRVRANSSKMVMGLLYWLIPASLGQEYGWYMDEGALSLLPVDEARRSWREWAEKRAAKK